MTHRRVLLCSMAVATALLAGCFGGDDDGEPTPSPSPTPNQSAGVVTTIEITKAPASSPAGSNATVCWTLSGAGTVPHTAIHWDNVSHAAEPTRTFQAYDLGASYPGNQSSAAPQGYDLPAEGGRFCTAARMPASGSIFVVAHVIDSTGAPGRITTEREIRVGASSDAMIRIQAFTYLPATLTVASGSTISVQNADTFTHTVTSTATSAFDTGDIAGGATDTFMAPADPGSYPFKCAYHDSMTGVLEVV